MKAAIYTLGCKVNQYESQIMEQRLSSAGFEIVGHHEPADIYIVNSCTVTAESDRKTRQAVRRFKKENPAALTVLTGCFPQSSPEEAAKFEYADVVTGTKERCRIDRIIAEALSSGCRLVRISSFGRSEAYEEMSAEGHTGHTRAFVKIEDGCGRFCSYCIIPYSRGPVRSKPLEALKEELSGLSRNGFREAVLVGINLSAYGSDLSLSLADAIETACGTDGLERIRLGSLEPNLITEPFLSRVRKQAKLCPQFHLSLQSGCAATLRRMNRHYTPDEYESAVCLLRKSFPGCAVTTDVIVGFPGETEDEFAQSLAFVDRIAFAKVHIFPYSIRRGTAAASMPGQVEKAEKESRGRRMSHACALRRQEFLQGHVGKAYSVLFESQPRAGEWEGFTPDYTPVRLRSAENLQGKILPVRITGSAGGACTGTAAEEPR